MRSILRIPATEQYAYIEVEFDKYMEPSEVAQEYRKYTDAMKNGEGLQGKDWNACVDRILFGGSFTEDEYSKWNQYQKDFYRDVKNAKNRKKNPLTVKAE